MASKKLNPAAWADTGQVRNAQCLPACGSEPTKLALGLQTLHAVWIARRDGINPDFAVFIATLVLGESC